MKFLWPVERRRQFKVQQITAAIYKHPHGQELRVFLGEADHNLLHSELTRFDLTPLEQRANDLRAVLTAKGWTVLSAED